MTPPPLSMRKAHSICLRQIVAWIKLFWYKATIDERGGGVNPLYLSGLISIMLLNGDTYG